MSIQCWQRTISPVGLAIFLFTSPATAQLQPIADTAPDRSLGTTVDPLTAQIDLIRGGTRSSNGANLFHSFREFNIDAGRGAYFIVPDAAVLNVLARVTGGNPSQILGTLGSRLEFANGTFPASAATMFLINPSGVLFGAGGRLDVGRSFVATTADAIGFGNQGRFDATTSSTEAFLLTVDPAVYFFNQIPSGRIVNQSTAPILPGVDFAVGLQVLDGQRLTLLGGDVRLDGGRLTAFGGRVEVGAVAGPGQVAILPSGALGFASGLARGTVALTSGARVQVINNQGGDIGITAGEIQLAGGSQLLAGISFSGSNATSRAGNVGLDATGTIALSEASRIRNLVSAGTTGSAGDVRLTAAAVTMTGNSQVVTSTFGQGNGGNVVITVDDRFLLQSIPNSPFPSGIFSRVEANGQGRAGDVTITAGSVEVRDGGQLSASTFGLGDAGSVRIDARDRVLFQGTNSTAFSSVEATGRGQGGNVTITAGTVEVRDRAALNSDTNGQGSAGSVRIDARDRVLVQAGTVSSNVGETGIGQGGNVEITTTNLDVRDNAELSVTTFGRGDSGDVVLSVRDRAVFQTDSGAFSTVWATAVGNGGNVEVSAGSVELRDGGLLSAGTFGKGDSGNVIIRGRDRVELDRGRVVSIVPVGAVGRGGDIQITTSILNLNQGLIDTSAVGRGNAGNIVLDVQGATTLTNGSLVVSNIGSPARQFTVGNVGNIVLTTQSLFVAASQFQAGFYANTQGQAGVVSIQARDAVVFTGANTGIFNNAEEGVVGNGSSIQIMARSIALLDGAILVTSNAGRGDAGAIILAADNLEMRNGTLRTTLTGQGRGGDVVIQMGDRATLTDSTITTQATQGFAGGNITIAAQAIRLLGDGDLVTVAEGRGRGGDITLTADTILAFNDSDILTFAPEGRGGNITFNTPAFFGQNYRPAPFGTNPVTLEGNNRVDINASGTVSGIISLPDVSFLQNGLNQLPNTQIDTNALLANSCIVRTPNRNNSFYVTGSSSLPLRPGDPPAVPYPTGELRATVVRSQESGVSSVPRVPGKRWQKGDPIVEPDGVYQLPDGQLILSRECTHE